MNGEIRSNIAFILNVIREKSLQCGRRPEEIKLMAVTKTVPAGRIMEALAAGICIIGENYVQEALPKKTHLDELGIPAEWHMIGHLQTRKAAQAVRHFSMIHSVDRIELAQELSRRARADARVVKVLIEVNTGGETSKSGVSPREVLGLVRNVAVLESLSLQGLMTIPPWCADPEKARPYFRLLREIKEEIEAAWIPGVQMQELSMGMSADYPVAIEEGATIIRIGQGIFGGRPSGT